MTARALEEKSAGRGRMRQRKRSERLKSRGVAPAKSAQIGSRKERYGLGGRSNEESDGGKKTTQFAFVFDDAVESAAIDIENFQDVDDPVDRSARRVGPIDHVEVLFGLVDELFEDDFQEFCFVFQVVLKEPEVAPIDFLPPFGAGNVFEPAVAEEVLPVISAPIAYRIVTEIPSRLLAFNPAMAERLDCAIGVDAFLVHLILKPPGRDDDFDRPIRLANRVFLPSGIKPGHALYNHSLIEPIGDRIRTQNNWVGSV